MLLFNMSEAETRWDVQNVDPTISGGAYSSLALDSNNYPHISYSDQTHTVNLDLKYAMWNGSTWKNDMVDPVGDVACDGSSLVLDSAGNPHISYSFDGAGDLRYTSWNGSAWNIEIVDEGAGMIRLLL